MVYFFLRRTQEIFKELGHPYSKRRNGDTRGDV
jgi:hypothetical protein